MNCLAEVERNLKKEAGIISDAIGPTKKVKGEVIPKIFPFVGDYRKYKKANGALEKLKTKIESARLDLDSAKLNPALSKRERKVLVSKYKQKIKDTKSKLKGAKENTTRKSRDFFINDYERTKQDLSSVAKPVGKTLSKIKDKISKGKKPMLDAMSSAGEKASSGANSVRERIRNILSSVNGSEKKDAIESQKNKIGLTPLKAILGAGAVGGAGYSAYNIATRDSD